MKPFILTDPPPSRGTILHRARQELRLNRAQASELLGLEFFDLCELENERAVAVWRAGK